MFSHSNPALPQHLHLPDHAGDAQTQASLAFQALQPGGRLALHGYHWWHPGSLCHQVSAGIWAFIMHHEDRLRVVSWEEPVTVEKHAAPSGLPLGRTLSRLFGGVLVVNLSEAVERRQAISQHLNGWGVAFEFLTVERIPWESVGPDDYARADTYGRADFKTDTKFLTGLVGARRSHRAAVALAQSRGWRSVLILEDDTVFAPQAGEVMERIVNELPHDWEMLQLCYGSAVTEWYSPSLRVHRGGWLGGAYAVNHTAYDRLMAWWDRSGTELDDWTRMYAETDLRGLISFPRLAWENGLPSTIGRPDDWPSYCPHGTVTA